MSLTPVQTKCCHGCGQVKSVSDFGFKVKATGRLQSRCKSCVALSSKKHYEENKDKYIEKARAHNDAYRARNKQLVAAHLSRCKCETCGTKKDLMLYKPGHTDGQQVWSAMTSSEATVKEAIAGAKVMCKTCYGEHTVSFLNEWKSMGAQEREDFMQLRTLAGDAPKPQGFFNGYRGKNATAEAHLQKQVKLASEKVQAIA